APGASPGNGNQSAKQSAPEGRKSEPRGSLLRPSGAICIAMLLNPRLAPWATFCRPSGAERANRARSARFLLPQPVGFFARGWGALLRLAFGAGVVAAGLAVLVFGVLGSFVVRGFDGIVFPAFGIAEPAAGEVVREREREQDR